MTGVGYIHPAKLGLELVEGRSRNAVLAADVRRLLPGLLLSIPIICSSVNRQGRIVRLSMIDGALPKSGGSAGSQVTDRSFCAIEHRIGTQSETGLSRSLINGRQIFSHLRTQQRAFL